LSVTSAPLGFVVTPLRVLGHLLSSLLENNNCTKFSWRWSHYYLLKNNQAEKTWCDLKKPGWKSKVRGVGKGFQETPCEI